MRAQLLRVTAAAATVEHADATLAKLRGTVGAVYIVGTKTFTIKLERGTYRYVCDPHRTLMHGLFPVS